MMPPLPCLYQTLTRTQQQHAVQQLQGMLKYHLPTYVSLEDIRKAMLRVNPVVGTQRAVYSFDSTEVEQIYRLLVV